jgi:hypothetical protein
MAIVRKSGRKIVSISSKAEVVEHWYLVSRFVATDASTDMVMVLYEGGRENISRGLFGPPTELPTPRSSVFVPRLFQHFLSSQVGLSPTDKHHKLGL